jgi:hypothetical protein
MMTTLAALRTAVATDIRDPNFATFNPTQINALINEGVNEINRFYPKEVLHDIVPVASTYSYTTTAAQAFRVELYRNSIFARSIPQNADEESAQGGWELWAGSLMLPKTTVDAMVPATDFIRVWGYGTRAQLAADAQVLDADTDGEWAVRLYARWQAYTLLNAERALFKQWQAISQNTDISATQLQTDVSLFAQEWDRHRNQLRRLRRV